MNSTYSVITRDRSPTAPAAWRCVLVCQYRDEVVDQLVDMVFHQNVDLDDLRVVCPDGYSRPSAGYLMDVRWDLAPAQRSSTVRKEGKG